MTKHIIDYARKLDNLAGCIDEECRKMQSEADLVSLLVDSGSRTLTNFLVKDMFIEKHKIKETRVKEQQRIDHKYADSPVKTQRIARRKLACEEGTSSGCQPFTSALEVLKSEKDLFMKLLQEPRVLRQGTRLAPWSSHKIVIMKPASNLYRAKCSENVTCHCSSLQSHRESGYRKSNDKTTSFSFRGMKKKLKYSFGGTRAKQNKFSVDYLAEKLLSNRTSLKVGYGCIYHGVDTRDSFSPSIDARISEKSCTKQELKSNMGSDRATDMVRRKLDFSSVELQTKQEFDVLLEGRKHLSSRLKNLKEKESTACKRSPKTLGTILFSPEDELWPFSPRRDSQYCSDSPKMRFCPYITSPTATQNSFQIPNGRETIKEVMSSSDQKNEECTLETTDTNTVSTMLLITNKEHETSNMKSFGELKITEPKLYKTEVPREISCCDVTSTDAIEFQVNDVNTSNYAFDSISENETLTSRTQDSPASPWSIYQPDLADNFKYQEHQSPDSVLDPFFTEEANSPQNFSHKTERQPLHRLRLDFEDLQDLPTNGNDCISQWDCISHYVHSVMQASCLNWDRLSDIRLVPDQEFLPTSLFEEVEFPTTVSFFDPKLLFDHMNEVLIQIYKSQFSSSHRLSFIKKELGFVSLENLVLDEIVKEADFYLLHWTEQRTLNQLVSKDLAGSISWLNLRLDIEQIMMDIAEDVMEATILDTLQEFQT